jgi:carboxyl-terminal processing protease
MRLPSCLLALAALLGAQDAPVPPPAAPAAAPAAPFTTDRSMSMEASATTALLERLHISKKPLREIDLEGVVTEFCEQLDPAKLYLTQADVDRFRIRYGKSLDMYLQRGNLTPAFEIHTLFARRVRERAAFVAAVLADPALDLNRPGTFPSDRRKAPWPADEAALDDLWRRRVQLDLLAELLGEQLSLDAPARPDKAEPADPLAAITPQRMTEARERLARRYEKIAGYLAYEAHEVQEFFLSAFARQYDPHSSFFSRQSLEDFEVQMRNSLCGIGATLQDDDGYCTIKEIMPGGPLALDGRAKPEDRIIAVGQSADGELEDIVGMRLQKAISRIRGKQGSVIRLILEPAAGGPRKDIVLKRDVIKLVGQLATARLFEVPAPGGVAAIGVIDLPAFYGGEGKDASTPTRDVEELINKLKAMGAKALILDLRRNGGGLLNEAIGVTGLFIPKGPVVQVRNSMGQGETYRDEDPKVAWDGPLILLTSKASASASEIVAGALRDHRRALIVGDETTHGKGTVQNILELSRLDRNLKSGVKVTIQKWYAPSGSSIQLRGVPADVLVPSIFSVLPVAESDLKRPLPWDAVEPSLKDDPDRSWLKAPLSPGLLRTLSEASQRRQAELPEFTTHGRVLAWTDSRLNRTEIPLALKDRQRERADDLAFRDRVRKELEAYAQDDFASREVKLDAALRQEKDADPAWQKASKRLSRQRMLLEDENWPEYDIPLREAVRIAADWTATLPKPAAAGAAPKEAAAAVTR